MLGKQRCYVGEDQRRIFLESIIGGFAIQKKKEKFLEELERLSGDPEEKILDTTSPGYRMMKAMGWENKLHWTSWEGHLEPVSTMITMKPGDFSGLGYEEKRW